MKTIAILSSVIALTGCLQNIKVVPKLDVQLDQDGKVTASGGITFEPDCDKMGCA